MTQAKPQKAKRISRDRLIYWLGVVGVYSAGTLGLPALIGYRISAVHAVLTGVSLLAGWCLARWLIRRFLGV